MNNNFNTDTAKKHLNKLLRQYRIRVAKWSKGANGRAWSNHTVKIPSPTDVERFCVCMHEIKHVIDGFSGKLYQREYACEIYAIEQAQLLGFDTSEYEVRAKGYVTMCISKGFCRGLNLDSIEPHIKEWCGVDFDQWKGKRVFVSGWSTNLKIQITEH